MYKVRVINGLELKISYVVDSGIRRCLGAWTEAFTLLLHVLGTGSFESTAISISFVYAKVIIFCAR